MHIQGACSLGIASCVQVFGLDGALSEAEAVLRERVPALPLGPRKRGQD